jgi:hypothetical protein
MRTPVTGRFEHTTANVGMRLSASQFAELLEYAQLEKCTISVAAARLVEYGLRHRIPARTGDTDHVSRPVLRLPPGASLRSEAT